ncbi:MAG: sugar phosphate isomerase/epimerase family protein [Anaerolineae bacterium]
MRIAVVSDEISDDFEEAVQLGLLLGVDSYELRWVRPPTGLRRRRIGDVSEDDGVTLYNAAARQGASISAISPGLFYSRWDDLLQLQTQMMRFEHALRLAHALHARDIIIHGFMPPDGRRNGVCPAQAIDVLAHAAERAKEEDLRLLLRNTSGSYADTAAHTASIVNAVRSDALAISWDPCHAVRAGDTVISEAYEWVAPHVEDIRVKDQIQSDEHGYEYTVLTQGTIDWVAQLKIITQGRYVGTMTLGAQTEPRLLSTMHSLDALRKLLRKLQEGGSRL